MYLNFLNFDIFCLYVLLYLWLVRYSSYYYRNVYRFYFYYNILKNKFVVGKFGM